MEGGDASEDSLTDRLERITVNLDWNSLPPEIQDRILAFLPLNALFQARPVCKRFHRVVSRRAFHQSRARLRPTECSLSPLVLYSESDSWHVRGFDYEGRTWRRLPAFKLPIPAPQPDLFKDLHISGAKGLICVNAGSKLVVHNPLTEETQQLPALEGSRNPVVVNLYVSLAKKNDAVTSSFVVVVVGSAAIGTEGLSRKTSVYDSAKGRWEAAGDVPGAPFSVNDYQTGVYCEKLKLLLCVGFLVNGSKGILALDVEKRKWREDWICPFHQLRPPTDADSVVHFAIAQLVECGGRMYLFSEQEEGRSVTHCIDRLELESGGEGFTWTRVVTRPRQGNRALLVYPEYTCVPVGEKRLCIFNTIEKTGVVYDVQNEPVVPETLEAVAAPPAEKGMMFHSLNPMGYAFEPSFGVSAASVSADAVKMVPTAVKES